MNPLGPVLYIVGHHTAGRGNATLEEIRRVHVEGNGWEDIGYHFLVFPDGRVEEGRPAKLQGAHCHCDHLGKGFNNCSLGVAIVGTYDEGLPPAAALRAAVQLVGELRVLHPTAELVSHREAMTILGHPEHTDCPGKTDWVAWVRVRLPFRGPRGLL